MANTRHPMNYRYDLLKQRRLQTGDKYEDIAARADLSINAVWKTVNGKTDPSASTLKAVFEAMGLDPSYALNFDKRLKFRRAVVATAR